MKTVQLEYKDGRYYADIDISVEEWKEMLRNKKIFNELSLDMIFKWYAQINHQATSKEILTKYNEEYLDYKSSPFNGIVAGLGKRILKYLNQFEVVARDGTKSYFIIPFEEKSVALS